jgi:hypothetical protein
VIAERQPGLRVDADLRPTTMGMLMVIITKCLEPVERWVRIAALRDRHAMVHLDRLGETTLETADLTQVVAISQLRLA